MTIKEAVQKELKQKDLEELEQLSDWWDNHVYNLNTWESEEEYESRRALVVPLLVEEKLKFYEQEYD